MDILENVIYNLSSDEVRRFKILSNRFKADEEKKLLVLFDLIRSEKYIDDESQIVIDLYGESNARIKNRYYRLRNKLLEVIEKSLVFYHFKYKDSIHAYYDIQLSILFRERGNYRLSAYFLKKAEKKALELDQFNILELIYEEYIQLAIKEADIDIDGILERRKRNLEKIRMHRKLTQTIALITVKLKKSNFSRANQTVVKLLENVKQQIEDSADIFHSSEGKILITRTVATLLQQKSAFPQLIDFLNAQIYEFKESKVFNNNNHSFRLQMRLWLTISLFKEYRLQEAWENISILEEEMEMFDRQNYFTYLFNYFNIKEGVMKCMGKNKEAGPELEKALAYKEMEYGALNIPYLLVGLSDQQFSAGKFEDALKTLKTLRGHSHFSSLPEALQCHVEVFQMINAFESGDFAYMDKHFKSFKKRHKKVLKQSEYASTTRIIELLGRMNNAARNGKRVSINSATSKFIERYPPGEIGGNTIILFEAWLRAKKEEKTYYKVFLEEVGKRKK